MNVENLKRVVKVLKDVPDDKFGMKHYLTANEVNGCLTVACVLGHCVISDEFKSELSTNNVNFSIDVPSSMDKSVNILSRNILGLEPHRHSVWLYLFAGEWYRFDNTIEGAIKRLNKVISGFQPQLNDLPWEGE